MARVKVTNQNIQAKLTQWANGTNLTDELIYYKNEVNIDEMKQKAWTQASMIIQVLPDTVEGFFKMTWVEDLG